MSIVLITTASPFVSLVRFVLQSSMDISGLCRIGE